MSNSVGGSCNTAPEFGVFSGEFVGLVEMV